MSNRETVRQIHFTVDVYKKNPWFVPIEKVGTKYITGQELTSEKMMNPEKMTDAEREKYPHVIDPRNTYQVRHLASFDISKPYDLAMYNLIIASRKIAKSKVDYTEKPVEFQGYFSDKQLEAVSDNAKEDNIYEATSLIMKLSVGEYRRIATILNYVIKGNFYIPVKNATDDVIRNKLLKASRSYPDDVKRCFAKHNPGIEKYSFVLELLENNIIRETPRGEFFYAQELLGTAIDEVIANFSKHDGRRMKQILESKLGATKAGIKIDGIADPREFQKEIANLKALLFDGEEKLFISGLESLKAKYSSFCQSAEFADDMDKLDSHYDKLTTIDESKGGEPKTDPEPANKPEPPTPPVDALSDKKDKFAKELEVLDLERIQGKIKHPRTPYKEPECKDFWDNKEQLIGYMVKVKFQNA